MIFFFFKVDTLKELYNYGGDDAGNYPLIFKKISKKWPVYQKIQNTEFFRGKKIIFIEALWSNIGRKNKLTNTDQK